MSEQETKAVVPWKEAMQEKVRQQSEAEKITGTFISLKAGVMSYGGLPIQGNKADMIILESIHENVWYAEEYGSSENQVPGCYAFSPTGENMVPHKDAPNKQAKTCAECPQAKWGSAKGQGGKDKKACSQRRRLAAIPSSAANSAEAIASAATAYIRVPVMSVRYWAAYVQNVIAKTDLPFFGSITNVALVPDTKTQIRLVFTHVATIKDDELLEAIYKRAAMEATLIDFPYPQPQATEVKPDAAKKVKSKF